MKNLVRFVLMFLLLFVVNSSVYSQSIFEKYSNLEKNFYSKYVGKWFDNEQNVFISINYNGIIIESEKDKKILYRDRNIYDETSIYNFCYKIKDTFWGNDIDKSVSISIDDFDKEHIILIIYSEKENLLQKRNRIKFSLTKKEKQTD